MKQFYTKLAVMAMLFGLFQDAHAQTYRYALKFNYGVFNYNDKTSETIKDPLDRPFSLGGQFQSNFSKAFTNSIGFNTYKWSNNSSYNIQEMLFLSNNTRLLNRLKPQIGFGVGFEESKTVVSNTNTYKQYAYIPVNVGLQTDLTNRISLGIFGEIKYGFDLKNFDINNGVILPNNTAGISIAYRFSKVQERAVYPEIIWDNNESLITVESLKGFQNKKMGLDTNSNNPFLSPLSVAYKGKNTFLLGDSSQQVTKMKALKPILIADSISYYKDSMGKIVMDKSLARDTNFKQTLNIRTDSLVAETDSLTLYIPQVAAKKQAVKTLTADSLRKTQASNNFKLTDFTEPSNDTVYVINKLAYLQNNQPALATTVYNPEQVTPYNYTTPQNNYAAPQSSAYIPANSSPPINYANQTPAPVTVVTQPSNTTTGLQVAETSSSALLNAQLGKLITLQTQTLALLASQSKINADSGVVAVIADFTIDSLKLKIANLEKRIDDMQYIETDTTTNSIVKTVETTLPAFCVISYGVNKTDLTDAQRNLIINSIFKSYLKGTNKQITLASFTDNSGSVAYNKKLSDLRLKRVVQFLSVLGVKAEDIIAKSYGESKSSEEQNPEERRLEIKLIEK